MHPKRALQVSAELASSGPSFSNIYHKPYCFLRVASAALIYVGLIGRFVRSQEQLNIDGKKGNDTKGTTRQGSRNADASKLLGL